MDEGIAIAQRSTLALIDVEFTEGGDVFVSNDEADSSITERLVTALLSCTVTDSPPQGIFIRGKLSQVLIDDNLLHLAHVIWQQAEVVDSEWNRSGKEEKVVCA